MFRLLFVADRVLLFFMNYGILGKKFLAPLSLFFCQLEAGSVMHKGQQAKQLDAFTLFPDLMQNFLKQVGARSAAKQ